MSVGRKKGFSCSVLLLGEILGDEVQTLTSFKQPPKGKACFVETTDGTCTMTHMSRAEK